MLKSLILFSGFIGVFAASLCSASSHHSHAEAVHNHAKLSVRAQPDDNVTFTLSLRGENFHLLEREMLDIVNTGRPWLTIEQLQHFTSPSEAAKRSIETTLKRHGISAPQYSRMEDHATVTSTVHQAEQLFETQLHQTTDAHSKRTFIHAQGLRVPASIAEHVVTVRGLSRALTHKPRRGHGKQDKMLKRQEQTSTSVPTGPSKPGEAPPGCLNRNASWPCIERFYGYDQFPVRPNSESVAVINFDAWTDASIYAFERNYFSHKPRKLPNKLAIGDKRAWQDVRKDNGEAILDVQMLLGTAYDLDVSVILSPKTVGLPEIVEHLIAMPDASRPGVVSLSYGYSEHEVERSDAIDFCNKAQQLAALGTTFFTGTGDTGVRQDDKCPPFGADAIASCPYVVGVGATTYFAPERAGFEPSKEDTHNGWSGGGFSGYFTVPDYQKQAVAGYLKSANPSWSHHYNPEGRGYTDIAAFGQYVNTATTHGTWFGGGTSASSPLMAGMFARLNAICKTKGKRRVGWVQPVLYSERAAGAIRDNTQGGSFLCPDFGSPIGFPCAKGWDPATGLGAIHFPGLVKAFC